MKHTMYERHHGTTRLSVLRKSANTTVTAMTSSTGTHGSQKYIVGARLTNRTSAMPGVTLSGRQRPVRRDSAQIEISSCERPT
jgi:hypothetical protein